VALIYLGLGSNLDAPQQQLLTALETLAQTQGFELIQTSRFYGSTPQGPQDQPDYVNAVCLIRSQLTPQQVLDQTQAIEQQFGRVKTRHWGERCIDIDILLYDDLVMASDRLTIPHPFMTQRDFVLLPLLEIAPDIEIPQHGAAQACMANLQQTFVKPTGQLFEK